jgi:rsbT co-antagonist protein RsbR
MSTQPDPVSRNPLLTEIGLTGLSIERRLCFVGFTPDDVPRVRALGDLMSSHVDDFTAAFFTHLASFEEAAGLIENVALMNAARQLKTEHLRAMVSGIYNEEYVEGRLRLGTVYANAGLDPRVFLGAFHHMMRAIGFQIMERFARSPIVGFENFMALKKIAFFDLSLIVDVIVGQRERMIAQLQDERLRELSTPVLQVRERLLVLPLIGNLSAQRARDLTDTLLTTIRTRRAKVVVLDITGVRGMDSAVADRLMQTVRSARLMGAVTVLTGVSSEIAQTLTVLGVDLTNIQIAVDLQRGLERAEHLLHQPHQPA